MNLQGRVQALDALAANLTKATSIRDKVKLADRIFEALGECERLVEQFIVSELGTPNGNGVKRTHQTVKVVEGAAPITFHSIEAEKPFKKLTLAAIGKILLKERGVMHGAEIEALAKAGGFKGKAVKFQSYLAVAFKRDGGFENLGKNRWKLKDSASETLASDS